MKQNLGGCYTIGDCIDFLLNEKNESQNWLAQKTGIDKNTLNSYKNENVKPSIRKVMAIAIAFHLPPEHSYIMIKKVGDYPPTKEGSDLFMVMTTMYERSVVYINKYLIGLGYKPLTEKTE